VLMFLAVIFGAFASHYLRSILTQASLSSFEVGVRYLVYHGLALLIISFIKFRSLKNKKRFFNFLFTGVILFSGSIFTLSFKAFFLFPIGWLGALTPLGGTLLIAGWFLLILEFYNRKTN
jgi:uncharacterized membrane protein YgdD (TMEM256/DUF423 family)